MNNSTILKDFESIILHLQNDLFNLEVASQVRVVEAYRLIYMDADRYPYYDKDNVSDEDYVLGLLRDAKRLGSPGTKLCDDLDTLIYNINENFNWGGSVFQLAFDVKPSIKPFNMLPYFDDPYESDRFYWVSGDDPTLIDNLTLADYFKNSRMQGMMCAVINYARELRLSDYYIKHLIHCYEIINNNEVPRDSCGNTLNQENYVAERLKECCSIESCDETLKTLCTNLTSYVYEFFARKTAYTKKLMEESGYTFDEDGQIKPISSFDDNFNPPQQSFDDEVELLVENECLVTDYVVVNDIVALLLDGRAVAYRFKTNEGYFDMSRAVALKYGISGFKIERGVRLQRLNGLLVSQSEINNKKFITDVTESEEDCIRLFNALFRQ